MAAPLVPPRRGGRLPAAAAAAATAGFSPQPAAFGLGTNARKANAETTSSGTVSDYAHGRPWQTLQAKAAGHGAIKADSGQRAVASKMQVDMTSTAHSCSACYLAAVTASYNCRPHLEEAKPGDLLVITWWHTLDQSWGQVDFVLKSAEEAGLEASGLKDGIHDHNSCNKGGPLYLINSSPALFWSLIVNWQLRRTSGCSPRKLDVCSMAATADWEDAFSRAAASPSTKAIDCPNFCTEAGCTLQERCPFNHSATRHQWCCSRALVVKQAKKENSSSDEQYTVLRAGISSSLSGSTMDNSRDFYRHHRRLSLADQMGDISILDCGLASEENLLA